MKITAFILLAFCMHVSATTLAQNVTLSERKAPLEKVINEIKQQTGYSFFYNQEWLRQAKPVDVNVKNVPIEEALRACFAGQPYNYKIVNTTIVLSQKEVSPGHSVPVVPEASITISGRVTDTVGKPLNGATLTVKNGKTFIADDKGEFSLTAQSGDQVTVSYVGYRAFVFTVTSDMPFQNIVLRTASNKLTEVVINYSNGFQNIPKERATGSYDFIDNALYNREVGPDVLTRLDGITNSYFVNRSSGIPNDIYIRGVSTILGNTQPLIVVDNFPYAGDINNIDPNDIENVTILKDAAAASIWGAKAGNGVIVFTTKKGKYGQPLQINFNSNVAIQNRPNLKTDRSYVNSNDFINVEQFLYNQGFYNSDLTSSSYNVVSPVVQILANETNGLITPASANAQINALRNIDNRGQLEKYFYQKAVNQQYSLSFNGGTSTMNYLLSVGYDKNLTSLKGDEYDKQNIHSIASIKPIRNLNIQTSLDFTHSTQNNGAIGYSTFSPGGGKARYYPYALIADQNGNPVILPKDYAQAFKDTAGNGHLLDWNYRPLTENANTNNVTQLYDIKAGVDLNYHIFEGFTAGIAYQYEKSFSNSRVLQKFQSYYVRNLINEFTQGSGTNLTHPIPFGDILDQNSNNLDAYNIRPNINFNHSWNNKHELSFIAGMDINQTHSRGASYNTVYGYDDNYLGYQQVNFTSVGYSYYDGIGYSPAIPSAGGFGDVVDRFVSYFANASYTFDRKYILTGSARKDESNLFGANTNNRGTPLWSTGLKWKISDESFYKSDLLPDLALRATYGYQGNVLNTLSALPVIAFMGPSYQTNLPYSTVFTPSNPNLRWEKDGQLNLGVDFGLKDNVVTGSVEYYLKNATDLIVLTPVDPTTGFQLLTQNSANMQTRGFDVALNVRALNKSIKWNIGFNFNYVRSKVTKYLQPVSSPTQFVGGGGTIAPLVGHDPYALFSYKFVGLDPQTGDPQGLINGQVSKDYSNLTHPSNISDLVQQGTGRPPFFGNLTNSIEWRGFTLSANVLYRFGFNFRKSTINYDDFFNTWAGNVDFEKRWQKPGDEKFTTIPSMTYPSDYNRDAFYRNSTATVLKGDFIRLQDINLSYDFKPSKTGAFIFKKLSAYVYANNLGIIWRANKEHIDPDAQSGMPIPFSLAFGVRGSF
ncbi:MAG: SusC/RagA family TonB-linked outer membrane protein [Mucilaginibacter sp.]